MHGDLGHGIDDVRAERHYHRALGVSNDKPRWSRGLALVFVGLPLVALVTAVVVNAVIG